MESHPDNLPLPDLYLIDSHKLLKEVSRVRGLVLQIPVREDSHAATQTVVDALWRMESNMIEILKVQAAIHASWGRKAEELNKANELPQIGLRVIS
jgi:uncharacterized protein HemY